MITRAAPTMPIGILPAALIALAVVPVIAGVVRVLELAGGGATTPANARFFAAPFPVVVHIVAVTLFSVLGAFQFAPRLRQRYPRWHRVAGRVLVASGIVTALTGLWMSWFNRPIPGDNDLLFAFRLVFGTGMLLCLVLGLVAIRRRRIAQHRAWITRGYALGMGAGTQVVVYIPWLAMGAVPDDFTRSLLMGAAWMINLAVAEWAIRRWSL